MISRIPLIRNIGTFDSVIAGRDLPLDSLTLVYAENGRGKTTLAAVFRSLSTGDPLPIAQRRRLSAQHPPHVVVGSSGSDPDVVFENNAWSRPHPGILVFDDVFIDENIYSGLDVESQHRKNLHDLVLGERSVTLAKHLRELVQNIEAHNRELTRIADDIPAAIRGSLSVDAFCALPMAANIDDAIQRAEQTVAAASHRDSIEATPQFELLDLPTMDLNELEQLLAADFPSLDAAALNRVQSHFRTLGLEGETWVDDGMRRITVAESSDDSEACPFCGQDLHGSQLIDHYRSYFSDAYDALKRRTGATLDTFRAAHGEIVVLAFERAVAMVSQRHQFWSQFCTIEGLDLDTAPIVRAWNVAREAVVSRLLQKQGAPLESLNLSDDTRTIVAKYETYRSTVDVLNRSIREANVAVASAKQDALEQTATTDASERLVRLKAVKARHEPDMVSVCGAYQRELEAKQETEQQRDEVRAALEEHRSKAFPVYEKAINGYLGKFNAGFRLSEFTFANIRGGSTCTYNVLINNTPVPVKGGNSEPDEPTFRTTISSGDRNTLALAFFFALLDQDERLTDNVIVIDDPLSSLDEHRAFTTAQEIRRLPKRAAQVIVLSHKKPFLCEIWKDFDRAAIAAIEVCRDRSGSSLRLWDVAHDALPVHVRRHNLLKEYLEGVGDSYEVARSLRDHLEEFLRVAFPDHLKPSEMIGQFITRCQKAAACGDPILVAPELTELMDLNEYARRFHHPSDPPAAISDGELTGFTKRTLAFARRSSTRA